MFDVCMMFKVQGGGFWREICQEIRILSCVAVTAVKIFELIFVVRV